MFMTAMARTVSPSRDMVVRSSEFLDWLAMRSSNDGGFNGPQRFGFK
jgi:hypothetical protein